MSQETQHEEISEHEEIFEEVHRELSFQDQQWGGNQHDDQHRLSDWNIFVAEYNQRGVEALNNADPNSWRRRMVQVAALAISAIASFDRKCEESAEMVSERGIDPHAYPACSERPDTGRTR